jgi:RNA polymerase-binding transcription factor DksA
MTFATVEKTEDFGDAGASEAAVIDSSIIEEALDELRNSLQNPTTQCVDCEQEIEPERLEVLPGACRCLKCQKSFDSELPRRTYDYVPKEDIQIGSEEGG